VLSRTVEELERIVSEQATQISEQAARIAELEALVLELRLELSKLKEENSKNSRNSHLPPSSEKPGSQKGKKKKSDRRRGGQPGHKGKARTLVPAEKVAHFEEHFPSHCANCGHDLPEDPDPEPGRYQVTEVPRIVPEVTEHRMHAVGCPRCECVTRAQLDSAITISSFGPRLCSIAGLLTGVYHLSRRKAQGVMCDLLGVDISLGAISDGEERISESLKHASDEALAKVCTAQVKHTDGTGWSQAGESLQLWTIASKAATVFRILEDATKSSVLAMFGFISGILVSDRAKALNFWAMSMRQICWSHLLRKFLFFSERDDDRRKHGQALLEHAALAFSYWHEFKDGLYGRTELQRRMEPVKKQFEELLEKAKDSGLRELAGSCADVLEHKDALWTYLEVEDVEPTNNHAEQQLRGFVIWRKLCFGTQSERGNRFAERIMTVAQTAKKQSIALVDFLTASYQAYLFRNPAPSLFTELRPGPSGNSGSHSLHLSF
jgi:transposase